MADPILWEMLARAPNAGQAFSDAFNQGMKSNALSNFVTNPTDPNAQAAAAKYDPSTVLQLKLSQAKDQQVQNAQNLDDWHKYAGQLAKWADTPEKWDQGVDYLLSHNHPDISTESLMQLKGNFSPALRQSFMALGGVQDDKPSNPTGSIQDYEYAQQHGYSGSFDQWVQLEHPGMSAPVTIPYNATVTNGGGASQSIPTVSDQKSYDALPPGSHYKDPTGQMRVKGGQSGPSSTGGFQ